MAAIQRVEIYFEPLDAVKMAMEFGASVGIPLHRGVPAAIQAADQYLRMNGQLVGFGSGLNLDVQVVDEMSDPEWASFMSSKAQTMRWKRWKRWNAETTQGRWNVVVYLGVVDTSV